MLCFSSMKKQDLVCTGTGTCNFIITKFSLIFTKKKNEKEVQKVRK